MSPKSPVKIVAETTEIEPLLLLAEDVAKLLQVSVRTIHRWSASGYLPTHRVGRLNRYVRAEIEEWISDNGPQHATPIRGRRRAAR